MGFFEDVKRQSIESWHSHRVLPSLMVAQFIIESGWRPGGKLSKLADYPNHNLFGIKASSDWRGRTVNMATQEDGPRGKYWINADFRAYDSWADSMKDHAAFFTNTEWRRNNYRHVVGEKDYKKACRAVQAAGYATGRTYASSLIGVIEDYKLYELDAQAFSQSPSTGEGVSTTPSVSNASVFKRVGSALTLAGRDEAKKLDVTFFGDQTVGGAIPVMRELFAQLSAEASGERALDGLTSLINAYKSSKRLHRHVVLAVGAFGSVSEDKMAEIVSLIGDTHKILLVDLASQVSHRQEVSQVYEAVAKKYQHVYFVNWAEYVASLITQYYQLDGATATYRQLNQAGFKAYAEYVAQAVYEASAGTFEGRVAQPNNRRYYGMEDREYDHNGLYSPKGQSVIYNPQANALWGFAGGENGQTLWIDGLLESQETHPGLLLNEGVKYMEAHSKPNVQYTIPLSYLPEDVSIGDRGVFIDHEFNPPLYIEATVLEITTSDTDPASNSITIGNVTELHAEENDEIERLKREVSQLREASEQKYRKGGAMAFSIEASNGTVLTEGGQTQLVAIAKQGVFEVPSEYLQYEWERYSTDSDGDTTFNEGLKRGVQTSALRVNASDIVDKETSFMCRIFDTEGEHLGTTGIVVKMALRGKSLHTLNTSYRYNQAQIDNYSQRNYIGTWDVEHTREVNVGDTVHLNVANTTKNVTSTIVCEVIRVVSENRLQLKSLSLIESGDQGIRGLQGPKGDRGLPGERGADGRTQYTHIAYADSEDGVLNFSISESERAYIGMYQDFEEIDSQEPTRYRWTRARGKDGRNGIPGQPGADGRTPYVHFAYATSADGSEGFSVSDSNGRTYIGRCTDYTEADPTDYRRYIWSRWQGPRGERGEQGLRGPQGERGLKGATGQKGDTGERGPQGPQGAAGEQGFSVAIVTSPYRYEQSLINRYSTSGYEGVWTVTSDISTIRPRDIVYLSVFNMTLNRPSLIVCEVLGKPNARALNLRSQALLEKGADGKPGKDRPGENLLKDTFDLSTMTQLGVSDSEVLTYEESDGAKVVRLQLSEAANNKGVALQFYPNRLEAGTKISYRMLYRFVQEGTSNSRARMEVKQQTPPVVGGSVTLEPGASSEWQVAKGTLVIAQTLTDLTDGFFLRLDGPGAVEFKQAYVCLGTEVPTDYQVSSQDSVRAMNRFYTRQETEEYLQAVQGDIQRIEQEQQALATLSAVTAFESALKAFREAVEKDRQKAAANLQGALTRLSKQENELGEFASQMRFVNTSIRQSEEGILIGNQTRGTHLLINDGRIGFFNNGTEVAHITGNMLYINQAVFVERIQVSQWVTGPYEGDPEIITWQHIGG